MHADSEQGIVVDVEDDPRAVAANPRDDGAGSGPGGLRLPWRWVGGVAALLALVTATVLAWPRSAEVYAPPVVAGLADEPSFVWELEIERHITTVTSVGDALAVHSSSWRGSELQFDLLDPADGSVLWSRDYAEHVTISPAAPVEVRDLPGTPHLRIAIVPSSTTPGSQTLIVERETGDLVSSEALADGVFLTSTDQGSYVLVEPADALRGDIPGKMTLLGSPDSADPVWETGIRNHLPSEYLSLREHGRYLGLGPEFPGLWHTGIDSVYLLDDGSPEYGPEEPGSAVFIADRLVLSRPGTLMGLDVESGDTVWEVECECTPVEVVGHLFTFDWSNEAAELMRIEPRDGTAMWDRALELETANHLVPLADQLIISTVREVQGEETWMSCFAGIDLLNGQTGQETCIETPAVYLWSGEGQVLFSDPYHTLYAVLPGEPERRWQIELYDAVEWIDVVGSRLVVFDEVNGIVGALG